MDVRALLDLARSDPDGPLLLTRPAPAGDRVALLPASFDPPTVGHAALADAALREGSLVLPVYSVRTLGKDGHPAPALLDEATRVSAIVAFAASRPMVVVALTAAGLLVDQAAAASAAFPAAELEILAGSDKLLQVFDPRWYADPEASLDRLFALATLRYAVRAGDEGKVEALVSAYPRWATRVRPIEVGAGMAAVSSRDVRERLRRGEDVSALVPPEVLPFLVSGA